MFILIPAERRKNTCLICWISKTLFLSDLLTRIVIPLGLKTSFNNEAMVRLTPEVSYEGEPLLILTPQMASVPSSILKKPIGSLSHFRDEIINSLDFAVSGT